MNNNDEKTNREGSSADSRSESYNGWTNRETWAVALHINNDQGWQESVHDAIREELSEYLDTGERGQDADTDASADRIAGEAVQNNVEEWLEAPGIGSTIAVSPSHWGALRDIGSMWRVNWTELGESFLSDIEES